MVVKYIDIDHMTLDGWIGWILDIIAVLHWYVLWPKKARNGRKVLKSRRPKIALSNDDIQGLPIPLSGFLSIKSRNGIVEVKGRHTSIKKNIRNIKDKAKSFDKIIEVNRVYISSMCIYFS